MGIGLLFWILYLFWILFGLWWNWPGYQTWVGGNLLTAILIFLLGWGVFGPPIHG